jgi:isoquinoline 1-oxidoreductase alpha subunit
LASDGEKPAGKPRFSNRAKVAGGVGAAVVVAGAAAAAYGSGTFAGSKAKTAWNGEINVNGAKHLVKAAGDTPLLYVLKNELDLHGPRFGCGLGQCGACSVLYGGKEIRSCITPVAGLTKAITTLEGLPALWAKQKGLSAEKAKQTLHPVQQAWIDEQVPQCGYCQSGMIIMGVDLLSRTAKPTVAQIKEGFTTTGTSPHLCRCGTYSSITKAVQRASKAMG